MINTMFSLCELIGTIAFAISGAMVAIAKRVDLFGVLLLGVTTAFGGGIIRDLVLGVYPPAVFRDSKLLFVALITALLVFVLARLLQSLYLTHEAAIDQINNIFDALGLGAFAVIGAQAAMVTTYGDNLVLILFCGMTTGIGGGVLRDLLIREIPFVLKKRIYAVAALCGTFTYWLPVYSVGTEVAILGGILITFSLRMLATVFKWNLPKAIR